MDLMFKAAFENAAFLDAFSPVHVNIEVAHDEGHSVGKTDKCIFIILCGARYYTVKGLVYAAEHIVRPDIIFRAKNSALFITLLKRNLDFEDVLVIFSSKSGAT
jgi:hypothetical protein